MELPGSTQPSPSPAEEFAALNEESSEPLSADAFVEARAMTDPRLITDVLLREQRLNPRRTEDILARYPQIAQSEALSLELVAREYRQRKNAGESPSREGFLNRFPKIRANLEQLLADVDATQSRHPEGTISENGDSLANADPISTVEVPDDVSVVSESKTETTINVSVEEITGNSHPHSKDNSDEKEGPIATVEWEEDFAQENGPVPTMEWDSQNGFPLSEQFADESDSHAGGGTLDIAPEDLTDIIARQSESFENTDGRDTQRKPEDGPNQNTMYAEGVAYERAHELKQFGDYDLLGEIARGGMGVVFKAQQRKLKRVVALKMILAGQLAGQEDIRRFYVEAEAAAALDHPNIVPIYEVGEYRGQHFFSMGFVDGPSLADKIADHPLPPRDAAEMMQTLAAAVHYAHENGVIHRDLKPANVLLDRQGQPKITDFGLAKQTETQAELTTTGQIMGTPSYMPPEQALGDSSKIGPHSDLYSLGAMLYCLLTGRPPFQAATVLELLQQVRFQEPVSPKRLTPNVPADLETICLKCLSKEPGKRYGTAQQLAEDLERFLNGVPVLARPVGRGERVWRWCKRYPVVAGLIAAVVCSSVIGAAVSTNYAVIANRRAEEAMTEFKRAEKNFARAERNFLKAQSAVDKFFVQVSENTLLNQPGMQPLQHELLNQALDYYREFLAERKDDEDLQDELARTHFRVGVITEMVKSPSEALPALRQAREIQEELLRQTPDDIERRHALGETLTALGRATYRTSGPKAAEPIYQEALAIRQELLKAANRKAEYHRELANAHMNLGLVQKGLAESAGTPAEQTAASERALDDFRAAQQIRREARENFELSLEMDGKFVRDLGQGAYNTGLLHLLREDREAAHASFRQAVDWFAKALAIAPDDQRNMLQSAISLRLHAETAPELHITKDSLENAHRQLAPLVRDNPRISAYQRELFRLQLRRAESALDHNDRDTSLNALQSAQAILLEEIDSAEIKSWDHIADLGHVADSLLQLGELTSSRETYTRSLFVLDELAGENSGSSSERLDLLWERAEIYQVLARIALTQREGDVAFRELNQARAVLTELIRDFPSQTEDAQESLKYVNQLADWIARQPASAVKPSRPPEGR